MVGPGDLFFDFHGGAIDYVARVFVGVGVFRVVVVVRGEGGVGVRYGWGKGVR